MTALFLPRGITAIGPPLVRGYFSPLFSLDYLLKCTTESRDPKLAMKIVGATFQQ